MIVGVPTFVLKFTPAPKIEVKNETVHEWWPITQGLSVVDLLLLVFSSIIQVSIIVLVCKIRIIILLLDILCMYIYIYIRASVDALYRDGANVREDAHMLKSFHASRMCEYEPSWAFG